MRKVTAQSSWWDVLGSKISARNRAGNRLADQEAKKAFHLAKCEAPDAVFSVHHHWTWAWAKWMVAYAANFVADSTIDQEQAERKRSMTEAGDKAEGKQRGTMTHEKWRVGSKVPCRGCGREDAAEKGLGKVLMDACKGRAGGRTLAHSTDSQNHIWREHRYTEGEIILKGATLPQQSSVPEAMVLDERGLAEAGHDEHRDGGRDGQGEEAAIPWFRDPLWLRFPPLQTQQEQDKEAGSSRHGCEARDTEPRPCQKGAGEHLLRTTGAPIRCARCACHAFQRHGRGLKGICVIRKTDATQKRPQRLHAGRHPITSKNIS